MMRTRSDEKLRRIEQDNDIGLSFDAPLPREGNNVHEDILYVGGLA